MKVAVLPFNAVEGTKPALGRQFPGFVAEQLRTQAEAEINTVSYLTQIQEQDGSTRTAFVNIPDTLLPYANLQELFGQAELELVMDGSLKQAGDTFEMTVRFHKRALEEPIYFNTITFPLEDIFKQLHALIKLLAEQIALPLPASLAGETMQFGTTDTSAFIQFLEGFDALNYIQQANGLVATEFSPQPPIDALLAACRTDPAFPGPPQVLVGLTRACAHFRIGTFEMMDAALKELVELVPDQFLAYFALGEIHQGVGSLTMAAEYFEKAISLQEGDPGLYSRLGTVQLQLGMPINAERNFRKAFGMEGEDKPSGDYLAVVLTQTGRAHEVPPLWKSVMDAYPQNSAAHAKYAVALYSAGKEDEAERAFEYGLEVLEDNAIVKRYYAPWLMKKGDLDRAMDFYEDVLDVTPNDIQALTEYAQTLEAAGREFEVPPVMKSILASNPDPNTRAQATARLIELEQPKRVQNVEAARAKMEDNDYAGAVSSLKPLRNWLADYWKLWLLLASAYNRLEQYTDAEDAARRLLEIFPMCEPGFGELVNALHGQGKDADAYHFMQYVATHNPNSLPVHINLALAAKRAGQQDEARQLAKRIREAVGPNADLEPVLAEIER